MIKMQELHLKFSTHSRNAIIKECINAYVLKESDKDNEVYRLQRHINALHIQLNPDWKRKRSLPFHDEQLYKAIPNYHEQSIINLERKIRKNTPNGEDEE